MSEPRWLDGDPFSQEGERSEVLVEYEATAEIVFQFSAYMDENLDDRERAYIAAHNWFAKMLDDKEAIMRLVDITRLDIV